MKTSIKYFFLFIGFFITLGSLHAQDETPDYIPNEIYFKVHNDYPITLDPTTDEVNIEEQIPFFINYVESFGVLSVKRSYYFADSETLTRVFRVKIKNSDFRNELIESIMIESEVEYAEQIPLAITSFTPNDLGTNTTSGQYALHTIDAPSAWDLADGTGIKIAIVDNAFILTHPDLANKFLPGFDAADNDNDPSAPNNTFEHGTHVAGIAAAETDNGVGIASIGYKADLIPIKTTATGYPHFAITHGYEGIVAAADMGANVINNSWGGSGSSTTTANAVAYAYNKGAIIVAAAGNSANTALKYPAAYPNVVSVVSTDINDQVSFFSTYGSWTDVAAPGSSIQSCIPSGYGSMSGTSMASPLVSGLCALVWSSNTSLSNDDVVDCVLNTTDNIDALNPSYVGQMGAGRINAFAAVQCAQACPTSIVLVSPTDDIGTSTTIDYEADLSIEASNVIAPSTTVDYDAGEYVVLTDGFWAQEGTTFTAFIDGCGGLFVHPETNSNQLFRPLARPEESTSSIQQLENNLIAAPNPFVEQTNLSYRIEEAANVSIYLYDNTGQLIRVIQAEQFQEAGDYQLTIPADQLAAGIYHCKLLVDNQISQLKIVRMGL